MTPQGLQIGSPKDSFARLRIVTNGIVIVNSVFSVQVAGCRSLPVRIQSFSYLFFLCGLRHLRFSFRLSTLCDETRDACPHHSVEPLPGLNEIRTLDARLRKRAQQKCEGPPECKGPPGTARTYPFACSIMRRKNTTPGAFRRTPAAQPAQLLLHLQQSSHGFGSVP